MKIHWNIKHMHGGKMNGYVAMIPFQHYSFIAFRRHVIEKFSRTNGISKKFEIKGLFIQ